MKFLFKRKDGGPESTVTGFWLFEFKKLFSVVLLKFEGKSREAYHNHAFNAWSWLIKGHLREHSLGWGHACYGPSLKPIYTSRDNYHKVDSEGTTWVLSFRGPWTATWKEYNPTTRQERVLADGRVVVDGNW